MMTTAANEYILNVPLFGQLQSRRKEYVKKNVVRRSGDMACWYASATMVAYYHGAGPRKGLPDIWTDNEGLDYRKINLLAEAEGLKPVDKPKLGFTSETLIEALKKYGPIWAAGRFGERSTNHAIVITGVRGQIVCYNDPWEPMAKRHTLAWFNGGLFNLPNALLVRNGTRRVQPPFLK